ncbi:MAG: hypothetical protein ACXVFN_10935 [Solirubrobacteraceae bacterium]
MSGDEQAIDLVASVGELDPVVVALREFLHHANAVRAVAIVQRTGEGPAIVDCGRLAPIEVDLGDRLVHVPHAIELAAEPPAFPEVRHMAPFQVDAEAGEIAAPIGAVAQLADAVRALALELGGRNVAMAQWATTDAEAPLGITARADGSEPLVVSLGQEEFVMDEDWP